MSQETSDDEIARLEGLLRERARELNEQRTRAREAEGVVRDLMAQLQTIARSEPPPVSSAVAPELPSGSRVGSAVAPELPSGSRVGSDVALERPSGSRVGSALGPESGELRERTLEAEVGRAEAQLRLDELLGHFSALRDRERDLQAAVAELTAREAGLVGRERGLRAALAEVEENRDIARARATLLQHDLMLSSEDRNELARELAEARENLELNMARARTLSDRFEHGLDSQASDALRAELSGTQLRLAEQERAATVMSELLVGARLDGQEQRRVLGALRAELSARQADHREAASRIGFVERELERERDKARELAGEVARKLAETAVLREEIEMAQGNAAVVRSALSEGQAEAIAVSAELSRAHVRFATEQQRALGLAAALHDARSELLTAQSQLQQLRDDGRVHDPRDLTEPGLPVFEPADPD